MRIRYAVVSLAAVLAACTTSDGDDDDVTFVTPSPPTSVTAPAPTPTCTVPTLKLVGAEVVLGPEVEPKADDLPSNHYLEVSWQNLCARTPDLYCWMQISGLQGDDARFNRIDGMMLFAQSDICYVGSPVGVPQEPFKVKIGFSKNGSYVKGGLELTCSPLGRCK